VEPAADEARASGVSWPAVIAGAFVAAALSLALLTLGTGIGLSAASPWSNAGAVAASRISRTAIVWLILVQLIASSVGGYLGGRLRTKWVRLHTHEVFFRDTAHGFLVWAVSLVVTAAFLSTAAASVVGGSSQQANGTPAEGANTYPIERLLRPTGGATDRDTLSARTEIALIFSNAVRSGGLPPADKAYIAQLVTARTGAAEAEAEKRVDDAYAQTVQSVDDARRAVAHAMYWTFLALLVGAFCASLAATFGGRERDRALAI
jgi:hypothetical protein